MRTPDVQLHQFDHDVQYDFIDVCLPF